MDVMDTLDICFLQIDSLHMEPVYQENKSISNDEIQDKYFDVNNYGENRRLLFRNAKKQHLNKTRLLYDDETPDYLIKALEVYGRWFLETINILNNVDMEKTELADENLQRVIEANNFYRDQCRIIFTKLKTLSVRAKKKISGNYYDIYSMKFRKNGVVYKQNNIYLMK